VIDSGIEMRDKEDVGRDLQHCDAGNNPSLAPESPNLNAQIERFVRSIKEECLERLVLFGEESLRNAAAAFLSYYHTERNHQGLDNVIIQPGAEAGKSQGEIDCRKRLGGILRYYYRKAA
jgi:putative transposase